MTYAIFGGGVSGLAAAFYLKNAGVKSKIILFESSSHLGGWIRSCRNENGTLFELGPRTLRVAGNAGANSLHLAHSLNLENKINHVTSSHPSAKNRMIKVGNKLHKLPNNLKSALTKLPPFTKPLAFQILGDLKAPVVPSNDESFFSFAQRRFGIEVAKYAVDPFCRGIFAGNAKDLSVMALTKSIYKAEQKYGSVLKGLVLGRKSLFDSKDLTLNCSLVSRAKKEKWSVWSLEGGLSTLVNTLKSRIENSVEIHTNTKVQEINSENGKIVIKTDDSIYTVDKVISCLPAFKLKGIVRNWNPPLFSLLKQIPYVSVGLVNLEYSDNIINEPGFGYLIPSCESKTVLGVIYDSCIFPQGNKTVLTVMMGGYWFKEVFGDSPSTDTLLEIALQEIRKTFNINIDPINQKVTILRNCIPQYTVGHHERVENIEHLLHGSNIYLGGNSFYGVGVNDAIYSTKKVVMSSL
ncbi:UNVERIFIED_CONTAM: hypothetical protein RMT77_002783 [Armadillidium vulgare]